MTPRIRTIKPDLLKHEALFEAEQSAGLPLRLAFIGLFTCCDRDGRFRWQARRLKLDLLPYDDIDLGAVLEALRAYGFIQQYSYEGEIYGCIPSWSKHQYCNQREPESVLPALEEGILSTRQQSEQNPEIISPAQFDENFSSDRTLDSQEKNQTTEGLDSRCAYCAQDSSDLSGLARACTCGREGNGREEEGKGEGNGSSVALARPLCGMQAKIQSVFAHWKQSMHHPQAQLDPKRQALISKALKLGYSAEQLCEAITGCSLTPHNQGDNERGQRYDGLHIILRDAEQIDRFRDNCSHPPQALSTADRLSRNNAQVFKRWVAQNGVAEGEIIHEAH